MPYVYFCIVLCLLCISIIIWYIPKLIYMKFDIYIYINIIWYIPNNIYILFGIYQTMYLFFGILYILVYIPNNISIIWCIDWCVLSRFSCAWLFTTPWTVACQPPLSMGFSRQEYWTGLPCPPPRGSLPPRDRILVSCIAGRLFTAEPSGIPYYLVYMYYWYTPIFIYYYLVYTKFDI